MTVHVVKVPDIGEGIAEVELVEWHVKPGDTVVADQVLADVMTDKATVEVPSPVAGKVVVTNGKAGDKLAVGSELVRLESADGGRQAEVGTRPAADEARAPAPASATPAAPAAPAARPVPSAPAAPAATIPPATTATAMPPERAAGIGVTLASPSVRRHARELDVDLREVRGTGPDGRVLHDDVARHAASRTAQPASAAPAAVSTPVVARRPAASEGEQAVPVIGLRRQIATRMQESLRIPHFTYVEEIDVTELEALRETLNGRWAQSRGRLTLLPFLMRAIVLAVPAFPQVNARFDDQQGVVTRYAPAHIGIATQTGAGLRVPVVRNAEARDLWGNAAEVARLADAARSGKATREELSGSTITITSLGPLGGIVTTPIINAPEVAIVGVNRIVERPVIRGGAIVPRRLMNLSSSFDHRVVDGKDAADFVQALRAYLECPALLFVE